MPTINPVKAQQVSDSFSNPSPGLDRIKKFLKMDDSDVMKKSLSDRREKLTAMKQDYGNGSISEY